jgi:hypothetical protein
MSRLSAWSPAWGHPSDNAELLTGRRHHHRVKVCDVRIVICQLLSGTDIRAPFIGLDRALKATMLRKSACISILRVVIFLTMCKALEFLMTSIDELRAASQDERRPRVG